MSMHAKYEVSVSYGSNVIAKVKRLRSWGMVNFKWFPDYFLLCNGSMIMTLHTLSPRESRV